MLDVACGRGRHALEAAARGLRALGLDRNADFLIEAARRARILGPAAARVDFVRCDLEADDALPVRDASCGAVLVFRYLHRPLAAELTRVLRPGGLLLYETFTLDQRECAGGPRNPAFLLRPGELPALFPELEPMVAREGLFPASDGGEPQALGQLAARRPG